MQKLESLVQEVLNNVRKAKRLKGEFIVVKSWEQGQLKSQRCGVVTIYYRIEGKNIIVHRERVCSIADDNEQIEFDVFSEALSHIILNWDEIWSLISTKPQ